MTHKDNDRVPSINAVQAALRRSWSLRSSTKWKPENPALGNCGVSALVAHDHLGGEILKTRYGDLWHFYNQIDGEIVDFTDSQFDAPLQYDNIPSDREEALGDTNADQYGYLSRAVKTVLERTKSDPQD
ncbi:MAG: hypothetical protein NXI16_07695 [Alphaproteobacteria bacterium]|nr:hypothetical protein [Alphaproteobacteria bacterium]